MSEPVQAGATFCDGAVSLVRPVGLTLDQNELVISSAEGAPLARWAYAVIERLPAPRQHLRLAVPNNDARLEIRDPGLSEAVEARCDLGDTLYRQRARHRRHRVIEWSITAMAAVILLGMTGIPVVTDLLVPFVPQSVEMQIGAIFDKSAHQSFKGPGTFECGEASDKERAGKVAFLKLFGPLETASELPLKLHPAVIRDDNVNAAAGPGGYFYVNSGIIQFANSPEELASVIAHELGHVAHRDFFRQFLNAAGVSYLMFAVLSGGTGTGGALAVAQKLLVERYSRGQEAAADAFSTMVMRKLGSDPHVMADVFERMMKQATPSRDLLLLANHPTDADRIAAIRATPPATSTKPLLSAKDWQALKEVCSN